MSYILEALRKSERARQSGQAASLRSVTLDLPMKRRPWLLWGIIGLLCANGAGIAVLWLQLQSSRSAAGLSPSPSPIAQDRSVSPRSMPSEPLSSAAKDRSSTTEIALTADGVNSRSITPGTPAGYPSYKSPVHGRSSISPPRRGKYNPAPSRPNVEASSRPTRKIVRHREELGAAADDDPDPETLSSNQKESREVGGIPRPAREYYSQPAEPEDTPSALHPAQRNGPPLLNALTPAIRDKVAPVKINIHAYADRPADRFVIVDMKKYQVGDQIPGSGLVREIRADGLVLEHDGVRFQVPRP